MIPFTGERRLVVPESYTKSRHDDVKWMISFAFWRETQPMWVRCNAKKESDKFSKIQKLFYLPQINQSPTSTVVVVETLKRALKFADHFKKKCCSCVWSCYCEDCYVDTMFIAQRAFHIELSFFSTSGMYIAELGGPYINEHKVIENRSLNGFIMGKNYDCCKRPHQLFALAFEILLFKSFLSTGNTKCNCK